VLADPVDQSDIDRSKASERSTSTSIASLEAQLAQESSNLEDAQIKAQVANEDYLTAVDELNTATKDAQTAQTNADAAASGRTVLHVPATSADAHARQGDVLAVRVQL